MMMKRTRIYIGFLTGWFLLAGQQAPAGEHFVTPVNPGASAPFATWATAGTNLAEVVTAALADATTPRVGWVSNGVYALSATITLNKPLTIRNWPGNEGVVVDGQDTVRCFYLDDTGAELDGLTLTRGSAGDGGAVFMAKGGLVQNCTIYSNATTAVALGYYNKYTSVATDSVIRNCRIFHNTGNQGGGIRMSDYRAAVIEHCRIYSNTATTASGAAGGGGVCLGKLCVVDGCTIFSNTSARDGGGIYAYFDSNTVVNCMIEGNTAANLGGGVALHSNNRGLISNCVIRANRAGFAGGLTRASRHG
jgi:parallel beta-helix repeat protein